MIKDLQLYDWVSLNGIPVQVDAITTQYAWYQGECFEPKAIKLSEEILKANGFEKVSSVDYKLPYAESLAERGFYLENRVSGLYMITDHQLMPILYVHELQRVLRCCGLWNLANNLKV